MSNEQDVPSEQYHVSGTCVVARLPERIRVPQDVEDIFAAFERAANQYVGARVDDPHRARCHGRNFYSPNDSRIISVQDIKELQETLRESEQFIPMRWALNALARFADSIRDVREALGMPKVEKKLDDMRFYYGLGDKVRELRRELLEARALVGEQQIAIERAKKQEAQP